MVFKSLFLRGCSRSTLFAILVMLPVLLAMGCAAEIREKRFTELVQRYPSTEEPLLVRPLPDSSRDIPSFVGKPVTVIVHPAYALFFRDERRSTYTEAKYDLLEYQLSEEAKFITETAKSGRLLILVIPGRYEKDSIAPASYTAYLNTMTGGSASVYYIRTETSHSGAIPLETTVKLHDFLRSVKAEKVLVGGGFIGRCQGEFYRQLTTYVENIPSYIVPEISALSPDDISSNEAFDILAGIRKKDYRRVVEFIERKSKGEPNILMLTPGQSR